jgi:hypothetical protein
VLPLTQEKYWNSLDINSDIFLLATLDVKIWGLFIFELFDVVWWVGEFRIS